MSNTKISSEQIIDGVALGGNPTTTTQSAGNNTTRVATTAFVTTAVANLVDSAPSALNTLNELAAALNDNASFFSTVLPLSGGTMTGALTIGANFTVDTDTLFVDASNNRVKMGDLATTSATNAPLHVAKANTDVQAIFGDNNSSIDDPSIRIIGRDSANSATRYMFAGLDADANYGFIGYNHGSGSFTNALNFDTSGNVGIGTSSPSSPLVVESSGSIGGGSTNANSYFTITDGTYGLYHDPNEIFSDINGTFHIGANHANGGLKFHTGGTSARMDITSSGNVGIGDTNPSAIRLSVVTPTANNIGLQVENSNTANSFGMVVKGGNDANDYTADFRKRDNTSIMRIRGDGNVGIGTTSPSVALEISDSTANAILRLTRNDTVITVGNQIGALEFAGADADDAGVSAKIIAEAESGAGQTALAMYTGTPSALSERLRIDKDGNIGIGTVNPTQKLEISRTSTDQTTGVIIENLQAGGYGSGIIWESKRSDDSSVSDAGSIRVTGTNSWNSSNSRTSAMSFALVGDGTFAVRAQINKYNGIAFGTDSAEANTLNDYEEGTWTPTLTMDSGSVALTSIVATYTKIGRTMTLNATMTVSSISNPSGAAYINNIPVAMGTGQCAGAVWAHGLASGANNALQIRTVSTETRIRIQKYINGSDSPMAADIQANAQIVLGITYNIS